MRRLLPACLACLLVSPAFATGQETERQFLSGTDKDHTVNWDFMVTGGRRAGEWSTIPVPSNWELQGFGTYNYGNDKNKADERGQYRHRFDVPRHWRDRRVVLVFEGSMTDTDVRVNGQPAGPVHQGGFYEFSYDVTKLLEYGRRNLLEVTVSKQSSNASINGAERDADFWVFGGIYRAVYLAAYPATSIERTAIDARADGTFRVDVHLAGVARETGVAARIEGVDGVPVGDAFTTTAAPGQTKVTLRTRVANPRLWSAEHPNLYRVKVTLDGAARPVHTVTERFGFRTIEVRARNGIYVNGARVILKGVNRHAFWPDSGRTTSRDISVRDVQLMKDMNMNAVRMSHYPPDKHFLDACDEIGLYVLDELTGWQKAYDTDAGIPLVRELVIRDVNHPSILFWDNGNEGGFNFDLDSEFAKWDPQQRVVLHPWDTFNGIDTTHYLPYNCCAQQFFNGRDIIMPTEFLHGLYDGGHGAALRDYWGAIERHPAAGGGFLWALADEGIVRTDRNGAIDTAGNQGPDGIVGPYREKEGSFYTIKELWSPVAIDSSLPPGFDGRLPVENKYSFTALDRHTFRWQLLNFRLPQDRQAGHVVVKEGMAQPPPLAPGTRGVLDLGLPSGWKDSDALALTVADHTGRELYTWRWMLVSQEDVARRVTSRPAAGRDFRPVTARVDGNQIIVSAGATELTFDATTARLDGVRRDGRVVSLLNGPRSVTGDAKPVAVKHFAEGDRYVIEGRLEGAVRLIRWRVHGSGWTSLEYELRPRSGEHAHLGVTFDYPENQVTGMRWLGRGPYRVWKNRLDGVTHDVWTKKANDGVTGAVWDYPEFRGHHADLFWATIETSETPITVVSETAGLFLRLLTPTPAADPRNTAVAFPDGNISLLHAITAIGTKFNAPARLGPASQPNLVNGRTARYNGLLHFYFGEFVEPTS
jgi:hypothetical protein